MNKPIQNSKLFYYGWGALGGGIVAFVGGISALINGILCITVFF
jgi:hypothetical protein